jgi:hypothetical protein
MGRFIWKLLNFLDFRGMSLATAAAAGERIGARNPVFLHRDDNEAPEFRST